MDELDAMAFDAVVRTAPRFGRFIGTGIAVGVLLGVVLGFALPNSTGVGRGMVAFLLATGFAIIGGLTAAVIVVGVDRSSTKPDTTPFPWEGAAYAPLPDPADGGAASPVDGAQPSGEPSDEPAADVPRTTDATHDEERA